MIINVDYDPNRDLATDLFYGTDSLGVSRDILIIADSLFALSNASFLVDATRSKVLSNMIFTNFTVRDVALNFQKDTFENVFFQISLEKLFFNGKLFFQ